MRKSLLLVNSLLLTGLSLSAAILSPDPFALLTPCVGRTLVGEYLNQPSTGCVIGNTQFSDFASVPGTQDIPSLWEINIFALDPSTFRVDIAQASNLFLQGPFPADFGIQYTVKVVDSESVISRATTSVNPGGGFATITKTVYDYTGNVLGASLGSGSSSGSTAVIDLIPPSQWIRVTETVHAPDRLLSSFTDTLSMQEQSAIPEPSTGFMVGMGAIGLWVSFRSRAKLKKLP